METTVQIQTKAAEWDIRVRVEAAFIRGASDNPYETEIESFEILMPVGNPFPPLLAKALEDQQGEYLRDWAFHQMHG